METKTNFSLAFLVVLGMFLVVFSVQAKADDHQLKETKLTLYYRDDFSGGPNATDRLIVGFPGKLWRYDQFGTLYVFDDLLTEGPELTSAKVGRLQGTFLTLMDGENIKISYSLVFTNGAYNGSTIQAQGVINRLDVFGEFGVNSGTGKFRYATGYVIWENIEVNPYTNYALVRVNATIRQYERDVQVLANSN